MPDVYQIHRYVNNFKSDLSQRLYPSGPLPNILYPKEFEKLIQYVKKQLIYSPVDFGEEFDFRSNCALCYASSVKTVFKYNDWINFKDLVNSKYNKIDLKNAANNKNDYFSIINQLYELDPNDLNQISIADYRPILHNKILRAYLALYLNDLFPNENVPGKHIQNSLNNYAVQGFYYNVSFEKGLTDTTEVLNKHSTIRFIYHLVKNYQTKNELNVESESDFNLLLNFVIVNLDSISLSKQKVKIIVAMCILGPNYSAHSSLPAHLKIVRDYCIEEFDSCADVAIAYGLGVWRTIARKRKEHDIWFTSKMLVNQFAEKPIRDCQVFISDIVVDYFPQKAQNLFDNMVNNSNRNYDRKQILEWFWKAAGHTQTIPHSEKEQTKLQSIQYRELEIHTDCVMQSLILPLTVHEIRSVDITHMDDGAQISYFEKKKTDNGESLGVEVLAKLVPGAKFVLSSDYASHLKAGEAEPLDIPAGQRIRIFCRDDMTWVQIPNCQKPITEDYSDSNGKSHEYEQHTISLKINDSAKLSFDNGLHDWSCRCGTPNCKDKHRIDSFRPQPKINLRSFIASVIKGDIDDVKSNSFDRGIYYQHLVLNGTFFNEDAQHINIRKVASIEYNICPKCSEQVYYEEYKNKVMLIRLKEEERFNKVQKIKELKALTKLKKMEHKKEKIGIEIKGIKDEKEKIVKKINKLEGELNKLIKKLKTFEGDRCGNHYTFSYETSFKTTKQERYVRTTTRLLRTGAVTINKVPPYTRIKRKKCKVCKHLFDYYMVRCPCQNNDLGENREFLVQNVWLRTDFANLLLSNNVGSSLTKQDDTNDFEHLVEVFSFYLIVRFCNSSECKIKSNLKMLINGNSCPNDKCAPNEFENVDRLMEININSVYPDKSEIMSPTDLLFYFLKNYKPKSYYIFKRDEKNNTNFINYSKKVNRTELSEYTEVTVWIKDGMGINNDNGKMELERRLKIFNDTCHKELENGYDCLNSQ